MASNPSSTRSVGLEVDGLREALLALNRYDKVVGKEARDAIRDGTIKIQQAAQRVNSDAPSAASTKRWIGRRVNTSGAGIFLNAGRYPRALSTEWGAYTAEVFGRRRPQRYMKRQTYRKWTGNTFDVTGSSGPGLVIQPTIRRMLPKFVDDVGDELFRILGRTLDKAGVPRKGGG